MSEKRFTDIWCSETGHIGVTDYGIDKEFTSDEFEDFLNELNDENDILKQQLQTKYIVNKQYEELQRLKKENEQLRRIGVMYQGHNPCETCTYCLEDKLCCGINPPILCDEMKKDYFIYGLCKKHKQIQKSFRRYDDE